MITVMKTPTRAATGRDSDKYIVRFPPGVRDRIAEEAKKNNRSMNAELVARIESSFDDKDQTALLATVARLNVNLADAELDMHLQYLDAAGLAIDLHSAVKNIPDDLIKNDPAIRASIEQWNEQAKKFPVNPDTLTAIGDEKIQKLNKARNALKATTERMYSQPKKPK